MQNARKAITEELAKLKYSNELILVNIKLEVLLQKHTATSCTVARLRLKPIRQSNVKNACSQSGLLLMGQLNHPILLCLEYRRCGLVTSAESIMTVVHVNTGTCAAALETSTEQALTKSYATSALATRRIAKTPK